MAYVTYEALFAFVSMLVLVLTFVLAQNKKK